MSADGKATGEIEPRRRLSEFFVPVARPRKLSAQMTMDAFGGPTRQQPNEIVNEMPWDAGNLIRKRFLGGHIEEGEEVGRRTDR